MCVVGRVRWCMCVCVCVSRAKLRVEGLKRSGFFALGAAADGQEECLRVAHAAGALGNRRSSPKLAEPPAASSRRSQVRVSAVRLAPPPSRAATEHAPIALTPIVVRADPKFIRRGLFFPSGETSAASVERNANTSFADHGRRFVLRAFFGRRRVAVASPPPCSEREREKEGGRELQEDGPAPTSQSGSATSGGQCSVIVECYLF